MINIILTIITIDTIVPNSATITFSKTTANTTDNVSVTVVESDSESDVDLLKSKWVFNTSNEELGLDASKYTYDDSTGLLTINIETVASMQKSTITFEVEKKNHNIECFVTANVPPVNADKYGIERVILNIISNAIKYTPENGVIKVYVGFVYNDAYIKVIDNGIGIPEADLSRIFERFYRVDKARSRELGGTGLGLPIAKEIIEQNNGSIDIKSEVDKGTEVVIRIPVYKK